VRDVGILGAAAMVAIFVVSFGPALSILTLICARGTARSVIRPDTPRARHGLPKRRLVIPVALLLAAGSIPGILKVRTDIRAVEFLDAQSPLRRVVERVDKHFGGISMLQLDIDSGTPGGVTHRSFLRYLENVRAHATGSVGITTAHTYSEMYCLMNQVWQGEAPGSYCLPRSAPLFTLFSVLLDNAGLLAVRYLADDEKRVAHVYLRTRNMPSDRYIGMLNNVIAYAQEHKPEGVTVRAQEGLHTLLEADRRIVRSQGESLALSIASIFLFLCLLWRNLRQAALALVSAALPALIMFGIIGYAAIFLNSVTIMVAAIVLGIGVDDAIHFLAYYRSERKVTDNAREALVNTLAAKRRPIVCTSLILSSSLLLFLIFSFPPVRHFGILAAVALLLEMASVLLLVPAGCKFARTSK
jgi:predicted RND superfamily exporter protein